MSRAFVKENDGEEEDIPLARLPTGPLRVTAATLAEWRAQLAEAEEAVHRLHDSESPEDRLELAKAKRQAAALRARVEAAVVMQESGRSPDEVGFGCTILLQDETGRQWRFTLVGGEEADAAAGRISWQSPLGRALSESRLGDTVTWPRRDGALELTIVGIEPPQG